MVRLPPPAVLKIGVVLLVVAPVETIATLPTVSVAPLKSKMPRPLMVTAAVLAIISLLAPVYCTVAAVLFAAPIVRPVAEMALAVPVLPRFKVPPVTSVAPWALDVPPERARVPAPALVRAPPAAILPMVRVFAETVMMRVAPRVTVPVPRFRLCVAPE